MSHTVLLSPASILCSRFSAPRWVMPESGPGPLGPFSCSPHQHLVRCGGDLGDSLSPLVWSCRIIHGGAPGTTRGHSFHGGVPQCSAAFAGTVTITLKTSVSSPGFKLGVSWCGLSPRVVMEVRAHPHSGPDCKEEFLFFRFSWTSLNFADAPSSSKDKETSWETGYAFKHGKILSRVLMSYFGPPRI